MCIIVLCRGNVSESEGEDMAGEGEVTLPQDLPGRGNIKSEQSAIRLSEVGVASFPGLLPDLSHSRLHGCEINQGLPNLMFGTANN